MEYSVLLDLYISKYIDKLIKDQDDVQEEYKKDKQQITDLLENKDKVLISTYSQGLLNSLQNKNEYHIEKALHLGEG